jgi:hypothetical protein
MLGAIQISKYSLHSYNTLLAGIMAVPAENTDSVCDIGLSCSHRIYKSPNHCLLEILIAGFFIWCELVKLCRNWGCDWFHLIHAKLLYNHHDVSMLVDIDWADIAIALDIHAEIERNRAKDVHLESSLHRLLDVNNQVGGGKDEQIVNV